MLKATSFFVFYFAVVLAFEIINCRRGKLKRSIRFLALRTIFYIYVFLVIKVTLFPIPYQKTELDGLRKNFGAGLENNFIPLKSISGILRSNAGLLVKLRQIGGNLCLMVPLAFYIPAVKKRFRRAGNVFMLLLACSCAVEAAQFLIGRVINY
ncbi:MAG: VanZ family protein, partial [Lachnospiraceae bacterium]|nr:VanZ family protein [Lachnospiraceae bacterium]